MFLINQITQDPLQTHTIVLPDSGKTFNMTLYFMQMQFGWVIRELIFEDFILRNFRVFNSLNMLHQFRNQIPFGLSCISTEDREPMFIQDFSSGQSLLRVLTAEEIDEYTEYINA